MTINRILQEKRRIKVVPQVRNSQPRHHLLHSVLTDVGVNLCGGDAFMAEQGLDVHQVRPGVEQVGGVSMA